jgi:hypothetical protein
LFALVVVEQQGVLSERPHSKKKIAKEGKRGVIVGTS